MTDRQYSAKEWLNEAYRIKTTELRIREEYAQKLSPSDGAIDYSKDSVQSDQQRSAYEERLISYSLAMEEVDKIQAKIFRIQRTRQKAITLLDDTDQRSLLIARYLNQMNWKQISKAMNYSITQLKRIHLAALEDIFDYISEVDHE